MPTKEEQAKNVEIGKRIADRRTKLGLTQEDLARKLGYRSKSTINKIELGINGLKQSKILEFANALNMDAAVLCGWANQEEIELMHEMDAIFNVIEASRLPRKQRVLLHHITDLKPEEAEKIYNVVNAMYDGQLDELMKMYPEYGD